MPKAGTKKSGGKRAAPKSDFAKVRHKVGRKVPQATNVTNTNVQAKRIVLPGAPLRRLRSRAPPPPHFRPGGAARCVRVPRAPR